MLIYNLYSPISLILSCWLNECPIYIWRPVGEYPESSGVSSGVRIKLNLWGCISCRGASDVVTFSNNMDQYNYPEILAGDFLPFAKTTYGDNLILHQDNDPKHASFLCSEFLKTNGIIWSKAPSNSPDLNPIEMIWADMKKHIASKLCKTLEELKLAIWEYRQSLTAEKCTVYITHLREKVIPAVISRNGGWSNM